MTILTQPSGVVPAQNVILYQVRASIPSGEVLKNAVITVTNTQTGQAIVYRKGYDFFTDDTITFLAVWKIDIRKIVQDFFRSEGLLSAFGDLDTEYSAVDNFLAFPIDVEFTYEKINATTGLLEDIGLTDNAVQITAVNAARQHCDTQNLDDYTTKNDGRLLFTNRPPIVPICLDENDFLQFWGDGYDSFEIKLLDKDKAVIGSGVGDLGTLTADLYSFGAGVVNINNFSSWVSAPVTIDGTAKFYSIQFGKRTVSFPPTLEASPVSAVQTYAISDCCDSRRLRLFWLNRLGGVDAYTFNATKRRESDAKSTQYEKFLDYAYNKFDFGKQKHDSRESETIFVQSRKLNTAFSEWLRELQTSTRVYKVDAGEYIAGFVKDAKNVISDTEEPFVVRELALELSIDSIIQNNV